MYVQFLPAKAVPRNGLYCI